MSKINFVLLFLSLTLVSTAKCSKMNLEKTNIMTTTEVASTMDSKSIKDNSKMVSSNDSKTMDSKLGMDDSTNNTVMDVMTMCNESFRIDVSYLTELNDNGSFPDETDKTPKCFVRCVLENLKIASLDDGKIDPERAAAIFAEDGDEKAKQELLEKTTYCAQRDEVCHCEMAYNFVKCLYSIKVEKDGQQSNKHMD